jgi:uncharacterized membrane protein YozB (DUF420 family)
MATLAQSPSSAEQRERLFFLVMAFVIAAHMVIAFSFFRLIGMSSFGAPWWVHVHAITMFAWLGLYVAQNWLVWRGRIANHRRLGILLAAFAVWVVVIGFAVTAMNVHTHRTLGFTSLPSFLAADWTGITAFGTLVAGAIVLRRRPDWHKRLMLAAMIALIGPGIARLLPVPLLLDMTGWAVFAIQLAYLAAAMIFDRRTRGTVHAAWYWGVGAAFSEVFLPFGLVAFPPFAALADAIAG